MAGSDSNFKGKKQINSTAVVLHQSELEEKLVTGRKNKICIELEERKR